MATLESSFTDQAVASDKAQESNSSFMNVAIPLLLAVVGVPQQVFAEEVIVRQGVSLDTNTSGVVSYWISDSDLSRALNSVVDRLLNEQVELDADAKAALYRNRWELYD